MSHCTAYTVPFIRVSKECDEPIASLACHIDIFGVGRKSGARLRYTLGEEWHGSYKIASNELKHHTF